MVMGWLHGPSCETSSLAAACPGGGGLGAGLKVGGMGALAASSRCLVSWQEMCLLPASGTPPRRSCQAAQEKGHQAPGKEVEWQSYASVGATISLCFLGLPGAERG